MGPISSMRTFHRRQQGSVRRPLQHSLLVAVARGSLLVCLLPSRLSHGRPSIMVLAMVADSLFHRAQIPFNTLLAIPTRHQCTSTLVHLVRLEPSHTIAVSSPALPAQSFHINDVILTLTWSTAEELGIQEHTTAIR